MANKKIVINVQDNVTDALVKSQNKRIQTLESLIKKKKKKKDAMAELRDINSVRSNIKKAEARIKAIEKTPNKIVDALKNMKIQTTNRIVPFPS
jgi:seryl-tRNA synthetase